MRDSVRFSDDKNNQELVLASFRSQAVGVYLKVTDRVRGDFNYPDGIWQARNTLKDTVLGEILRLAATQLRKSGNEDELKAKLFPKNWDFKKEIRKLRPRKSFLFWFLEAEDPWLD